MVSADFSPSSDLLKTPIGVFGLGHVGLPTALCLAELGWNVIGADSDAGTVASLQEGSCHFYEPQMQELLTKHLQSGKLSLTADVEEAVRSSGVLFLCVGTPQAENGQADLSQVEELACCIARNINGYKLIVEKSTVPAITGRWVQRTIARYAASDSRYGIGNGQDLPAVNPFDFEVASNPEFLQEGKAIHDFFQPDRIVCGVTSERARLILGEIYQAVECPKLFTDLTTAELIKHAANAFLATKVSFINMIADICETVGADVTRVAEGIGMDARIGRAFLNAGLGFGGYCLPKDLRAFIHLAEEHGVKCPLLRATEEVNESRIDSFLDKVHKALWITRGKTIAVLGLAFKAGTDDIRQAPSLPLIAALLSEGAHLRLYDPQAMLKTRKTFPSDPGRLTYCDSAYAAAERADALLVVTEWPEFREMDLQRIKQSMRIPIVIDGRNLFEPERMREAGFEYISVGRASVSSAEAALPSGRVMVADLANPNIQRTAAIATR